MNDFIMLIALTALSGGTALYLVVSRIKGLSVLTERDLVIKIQESKCLFTDFYDNIINPLFNYWRSVVVVNLYKESEKIISRIRINILKIECWLLKLTNYIRGKRNIQSNGNCDKSEYWKDINDFKNGLNGNGESKNKPA